MKSKLFTIAALGLLLAGGCASTTPYLDQQFGTAVNTAQAQQTRNPEASRNGDPVAGVGGAAADAAMKEYQDSFKTPPPTFPVINISAGGGR